MLSQMSNGNNSTPFSPNLNAGGDVPGTITGPSCTAFSGASELEWPGGICPSVSEKWTTLYNRFRRWVKEGFWDKLLLEIQKLKDRQGQVDRSQWNVDGTSIRTHVSAAGGRSRDHQEPANHGRGYSRGGFTSKTHLVVDNLGNVLNATLAAGQSHETTEFEHLLTRAPWTWGKTRRWPQAVAGDKGYSSEKNRAFLKQRRMESVIARKANEAKRSSSTNRSTGGETSWNGPSAG